MDKKLISNDAELRELLQELIKDELGKDSTKEELIIKVINGEDTAYTKDFVWNELFLPAEIKQDLKKIVDTFLSSRDFYIENKMPWKRSILLHGKSGNGKTSIIKTLISEYSFNPVTLLPGGNDLALRDTFYYAENNVNSLLFFEDLDLLFEHGVDKSYFINLMDRISTKNGILIVATVDDINNLDIEFTQRAHRFDKKIEVPSPSQEMALTYLKKWFGKILDANKSKDLSKYMAKCGLSYSSLKEFYISSMYEALSNNRKTPILKDIDNALNALVKEKTVSGISNVINTDKYFSK